MRKGKKVENDLIIVCNFTQVVRSNYRIGLPRKGKLKEIFNSDSKKYEGSDISNKGKLSIDSSPYDGRDYSIELQLPPLTVVVLKFV